MSLYSLGDRITITRGRKGEKPDPYPAQIVGEPREKQAANGRWVLIADVITAEETQAGELRLTPPTPHNLAFAFPVRMPGQEHVELLDGPRGRPHTIRELLQKQMTLAMAYFDTLPSAAAEVDLDAVEV